MSDEKPDYKKAASELYEPHPRASDEEARYLLGPAEPGSPEWGFIPSTEVDKNLCSPAKPTVRCFSKDGELLWEKDLPEQEEPIVLPGIWVANASYVTGPNPRSYEDDS